MYSDMSKRMSAVSLPKRNCASARASSVLPTPVGPRNMKLPTGRFGFLSPARDRRIARDTAEMARSWLTTRRCSSSSIRSSLSPSSWLIDDSGTPVHFDTTSSISALATIDAARARPDVELLAHRLQVLARDLLLLAIELRAVVVLGRDGALHLLDGDADALVDLAELFAEAGLAQLGARAGLVDQVDRLVGQEAVGDVAARLVDRGLDRLGACTRRDGRSRSDP